MGTELGQEVVHEMVQPGQCSGTTGRPPALRFIPPCAHPPTLQVGQHRVVDVVEGIAHRLGPVVATVFGWPFPVLGVVVPASGDGLIAIHQVAQSAPLPAVEVFQFQLFATFAPAGQIGGGGEELVVGDHVDAKSLELFATIPGGRLHGGDPGGSELSPMIGHTLSHGRRHPMIDLEPFGPKFGRQPSQPGEHQMGALHMPPAACQLRQAFHEQDPVGGGLRAGERTAVTVQLIAKHPYRVHASHHGGSRRIVAWAVMVISGRNPPTRAIEGRLVWRTSTRTHSSS